MTRLDECYERGLLRKVGASNDKALLSIAQSGEWITEAGYDCDAGVPIITPRQIVMPLPMVHGNM
jgi:hypothetical protein